MKSNALKIAFVVALFAALVGTSRSSWASTCVMDGSAICSPGDSFDLSISMPPGTYVGMNFSLSFDPGAKFDSSSTLDLVFYNSLNNPIDTFNGYNFPVESGITGIGVGYGLASPTTVNSGYLQVTLTGDTSFYLDSRAGPIDASLTPAPTPLPAALPLFATGLGALGLLGWRRKRKAQAA